MDAGLTDDVLAVILGCCWVALIVVIVGLAVMVRGEKWDA